MNGQNSAHQIAEQLQRTQGVLVVLPPNPTPVQVGAGLGVFLALEQGGKNVEIVCPTPMLVEANQFVGVQKVKTTLSGRNLVISFDYMKDAIEKVSYNVENGKFNLVVAPKPGHAPLSHDSVSYSYSGTSNDLVILVGTNDPSVLSMVLPSGEQNATERNSMILASGPDRSLVTEVAYLISNLGITPDLDVVNNLFHALVQETQSFTRASALDFETAAALVRAGATPASAAIATQKPVVQSPTMTPEPSQINEEWLQQPKIFSSGQGT